MNVRIVGRNPMLARSAAEMMEGFGAAIAVFVHNNPGLEPDGRPRAPLPEHPDDIASVAVVPLAPQLVRP